MIGTGEGIAIAGVCGTVIAGILKYIPRRNNNKPTNPVDLSEYVTEKLCDERSGNIEQRVERLGVYMKESKDEILTAIREKK